MYPVYSPFFSLLHFHCSPFFQPLPTLLPTSPSHPPRLSPECQTKTVPFQTFWVLLYVGHPLDAPMKPACFSITWCQSWRLNITQKASSKSKTWINMIKTRLATSHKLLFLILSSLQPPGHHWLCAIMLGGGTVTLLTPESLHLIFSMENIKRMQRKKINFNDRFLFVPLS